MSLPREDMVAIFSRPHADPSYPLYRKVRKVGSFRSAKVRDFRLVLTDGKEEDGKGENPEPRTGRNFDDASGAEDSAGAGARQTRLEEPVLHTGLRTWICDLDPDRGHHAGPRPETPQHGGRTYDSARPKAFCLSEAPDCTEGGVQIFVSSLAWHSNPYTFDIMAECSLVNLTFKQSDMPPVFRSHGHRNCQLLLLQSNRTCPAL